MNKVYRNLEDLCQILDSKRIPITANKRTPGPYPYYGANGVQDYINEYIFDDDLVLLAEDGGNFGSTDKPIAYRVSGKCWVNNHAHVLKPNNEINVDYLCYSLMYYNTGSLVNGATRKKLTQAAMRTMRIPWVPIVEQIEIVDKLKKTAAIIDKKELILRQLDQLIKSRFIEMFGDPQLNSKNYPVKPLSEIAAYWNGLTYKPKDVSNEGIIVLRSGNIKNGQLSFKDVIKVDKKISDKNYVKKDNILMCSRNGSAKLVGKVALIPDIKVPMAFGAFMMIIRSQYYAYLLHYFEFSSFRKQIFTGTTTINQITKSMLDRVKVAVPSLEEVNEFADFVQQVDKSKYDEILNAL